MDVPTGRDNSSAEASPSSVTGVCVKLLTERNQQSKVTDLVGLVALKEEEEELFLLPGAADRPCEDTAISSQQATREKILTRK